MTQGHHTPALALALEDVITVLFFLVDDDAYTALNPNGEHYESLTRLSDSEVVALALLQQLRGAESERAFSCGKRRSSSVTSSRAWSGFRLPRSTVALGS